MAKKYDLVVKTGEYTNRDGEVKARYMNIGVVMENDKGPYMLLNRTFNPAGVPGNADKDNIIVSMFEDRGDRNAPVDKQRSGGVSSIADDEVPY